MKYMFVDENDKNVEAYRKIAFDISNNAVWQQYFDLVGEGHKRFVDTKDGLFVYKNGEYEVHHIIPIEWWAEMEIEEKIKICFGGDEDAFNKWLEEVPFPSRKAYKQHLENVIRNDKNHIANSWANLALLKARNENGTGEHNVAHKLIEILANNWSPTCTLGRVKNALQYHNWTSVVLPHDVIAVLPSGNKIKIFKDKTCVPVEGSRWVTKEYVLEHTKEDNRKKVQKWMEEWLTSKTWKYNDFKFGELISKEDCNKPKRVSWYALRLAYGTGADWTKWTTEDGKSLRELEGLTFVETKDDDNVQD